MVKLPSVKVYSKSVSVSYPGQSLKCVKVTTLGPRTLHKILSSASKTLVFRWHNEFQDGFTNHIDG